MATKLIQLLDVTPEGLGPVDNVIRSSGKMSTEIPRHVNLPCNSPR